MKKIFLLDSARKKHSIYEIKQLLELIASFGFTVFHWHLTDDQAFRIPLPKGLLAKDALDHESYSLSEIIELKDFAKSINIKILPELDIPGHALALMRRDWAFAKPIHHPISNAKRFKSFDYHIDFSLSTYKKLQDIIDYVILLFQTDCVHLGGDEVVLDTRHIQHMNNLIRYISNQKLQVHLWADMYYAIPRSDVIYHAWKTHHLTDIYLNSQHKYIYSIENELYWNYTLCSQNKNAIHVNPNMVHMIDKKYTHTHQCAGIQACYWEDHKELADVKKVIAPFLLELSKWENDTH